MEAMQAIWTNDVASYEGRCVRVNPMKQWPKPVQKPYPPILVGGAGPTTEQRVLRFGDGWMASGRHLDGEELARRAAGLQQMAADAGRGPVPVMLQQATPTAESVEGYLAMGLDRCTFRVHPGDEASIVEQLGVLAELVHPYR
jgi:alkanesulfonate monooxygenase SsuD/methylene tetrahydromethanopterin reductase-like flavin-dependent oxidoreductase (luciferase family)